ncbi:MAG: glycosyltransferase [Myxococcales bacterium]|nr:glycosyltransferase [Myxococcales bacterium]
MSSHALSESIAAWVQEQLEALVARHFPGLELPTVFAGHAVGPDVRADLAFTLGHLHGCGRGRLDGSSAPEAIARVLRPIDGAATHTFFSYRVAETLASFGRFDGNPLLEDFDDEQRRNLALACDSTGFAKLYDQNLLPRNYAAVLLRCELGRQALGLAHDEALLERTLAATRALLEAHPQGWLDDSNSRIGRYDIYTADVYLFTEPMADRLGPAWQRGIDAALALVDATAHRDGTAISWGRSTGALSLCLTLELAALAIGRGRAKDPARWLALADRAFGSFRGWMDDGVINAHQYRSPYGYRGPQRRLQLTLDALGKLAWAALELREASADLAATPLAEAFPPRDEFVAFAADPPAGVWSHRSAGLAFVLPVVGATRSDYLPAPRNPGLFEVPVDADLPTGVPFVMRHGVRFAAGHQPRSVRKLEQGLEIHYDRFSQSGLLEWGEEARTLPGSRTVRFRVEGRTLHAEETLGFDQRPDLAALQVAEAARRPLHVRFECDVPHRVNTIDTAGLAEYRSFWGELPRVHQIDFEPAERVSLRWSVTPKLRVSSTEHGHHYHRSLYDPMQDRVQDVPFDRGFVGAPALARDFLRDVDVFHLHWPEWIHGPDVDAHRRFIDQLRESEVRIVWTQHNRAPHRKDAGYEPVYQLWAESADAAIHHSHWGEAWMRSLFRYGEHTLHRVIPHGHFGNLIGAVDAEARQAAEADLGLPPCALRLGVLGAPRVEKKVQMLMDAFAAVARDDLQLLVLCLAEDETPPDDPRIHALPHAHVPRDVFNRRLATLDVLVMPIEGGEYLTTGQFADAIGLGIPAITSDWPFLVEMLGEAALVYGQGQQALERCLRQLDPDRVAAAAAASRALQARYDWATIAEQTAALLEEVGTAKL